MTPPNYPVYQITSFLCLFVFFFLVHRASSAEADDVCDSTSCGGIDIRFPFGLREVYPNPNPNRQGGGRCSYPKFQVRCDNQSRTLLSLPNSDELVIKSINYEYQTIKVNDPNDCLPRRFLHNLNLSDSPFRFDPTVYNPLNLTFLRCSSNFTESFPLFPVTCLSDHNNSSFSVIVMWLPGGVGPRRLSEWCDAISSVIVPISTTAVPPFWPPLTDDIQLTWTRPSCGDCEAQARDCGFATDRGLRVACFPRPQKENSGIPRSAKYGLTIGVGIPGLLCLIGISYFMCGKVRMYAQRRDPRPITDIPVSIVLQAGPFRMGLDGPTIEKYPKILLGESGRLPNPNDNTCPICLSEYEPKETLRTIPECNHYFHTHCIDEWLKMNATCPLCRNSPTLTPSSNSSLSPSSSISSSS